jgi:uncharacterized protein
MNRLQHETSPYLRQHADNPVDWYPWGAEAMAAAQAQDKPILLSIGYSACHWCHVMAHESFEDAETAALMNRLYINIKVDREERPDVDDIYMQAVQAMTRGGGWPMTMFLLPDGRPFYGGTYYPLTPRYGMPSFKQVLEGVHNAFSQNREKVTEQAQGLTDVLQRDSLSIGGDESKLNAELLDAAYKRVADEFDSEHGGFGGAPKFPQPTNLEFLLRYHARTRNTHALHMVSTTLEKMARGGIYDHLGGGFARYSVDAIWLVPHFEKMLYDNAQLSRMYLHTWQITQNPFFKTVAEEVYDYILREMTAPEGGFYSATDADSEGEEGKFFVWSKAELEELLGDDAPLAIEYWGVTARGNFEGHNILHVPNDETTIAARLNLRVDELQQRLTAIKDKLYAVRSQRIAPGLDDKILAAWNGLMLASLAQGARVLGRADYQAAAVRAGEFLLTTMHTPEGGLYRTYKEGISKINGFLEDYAAVCDAFIELYQTTFDARWYAAACRLADTVLEKFSAKDGGFFDTASDAEQLIVRPRNVQDNAVPSGNALMARALLKLAALSGEERYHTAAVGVLRLLTEVLRQFPQGFTEALNATDMLVGGMAEVAIIGLRQDERTTAMLNVVQQPYRPNVVMAWAAGDVGDDAAVPLLRARRQREGAPTAYVCRQFVCKLPVTTADAIRAELNG